MRRSILTRRPAARRSVARTRLGLESLEDRTLMAVNLLSSFEGLSTFDGGSPPNPQLAAGPAHVVEVVDSAVAFFDKATGQNLFQQPLRDFFAIPAGNNLDNPLVAYDEQAGRFVLAVAWGRLRDEPETLGFAVSNTADLLDGFAEMHQVELFGARSARLGWNADAYVFAFDGFCPHGVACLIDPFAPVLSIDKSTVLDGDASTLSRFLSSVFIQGDHVLVPAVMHDAAPGGPMWLLTESSNGPGGGAVQLAASSPVGAVRVIRMDNVLSSSPTFSGFGPLATDYGPPPPAAQLGDTLIGTGDSRITNAVWRSDRLVAAQTVGRGDLARVRWYEFDTTSGAPSLLVAGELDRGPGVHTYLPAVEIAANGDIGLTFVESSAGQPLSMYITGRSLTDAPSQMREPVLVRSIETPYLGGAAGSYSGISVDPETGAFWAANQYALDADGPNWATQIAQFALHEAAAPEVVQLIGVLQTGVVAIGGQTTGVTITTPERTYELELGDNPDLRALAEKLNGRVVYVSGPLNIVPGIPIRERYIVTVETLVPAVFPVEVTGVLRTGIFAIGGETTGVIIETPDGTFELDLSQNPELAALAKTLNGQTVTVSGTLSVVQGVEIFLRYIITADSLAPVSPGVPVQVTGTLRTRVFAIGGETTGVIIQLDDGTFYELDLGGNAELIQLADQLDGRRVLVTGILNEVPGVEIPLRRIITVESLTPVDVTPPDLFVVAGLLRTDILAIGGETTGVVVFTADMGAFELDLGGDPALRALADLLHGSQVRVTGRLTIVEGVEIPIRRIIIVETLRPAL